MNTPAESIGPTAGLYDIVHIFLTRAYRKLPVVDDVGRVIGQVSRRDTLVAFKSSRDDPRLYGVKDVRPPEVTYYAAMGHRERFWTIGL